jgi:large subunit ribosomal protein L21
MYAIFELGSHQYRVQEDEDVTVFRRDADEGDTLEIDEVLLLRDDGDTEVGQPYLEDVTLEATVDEHFKGEKITVFKYKQREGKRTKQGHRDQLTRLSIDQILTG